MNRFRRVALAAVLLAALFGLCVAEAATAADRSPYPTGEQIVTDYESVVGERAIVGGIVTATGPTPSLRTTHGPAAVIIHVRGVDQELRRGSIVHVLGRLEPGHVVTAERVVIVSPSAGAETYKWAISGLAVGGFLLLFFKYWRVDLRALRVEVRDRG